MQLVSSDGLDRALGPAFARHQLAALAAAGNSDGGLVDEAGSWTPQTARYAVDALAAAIDRAIPGDGPGRLIGVHLADNRRCIAAIRAAWRCGDDVVCLYPDWSDDVIADVLNSAGVDLVVSADSEFRWPGAPVLMLPSADAITDLPTSSSSQRAIWDELAAARRAVS